MQGNFKESKGTRRKMYETRESVSSIDYVIFIFSKMPSIEVQDYEKLLFINIYFKILES